MKLLTIAFVIYVLAALIGQPRNLSMLSSSSALSEDGFTHTVEATYVGMAGPKIQAHSPIDGQIMKNGFVVTSLHTIQWEWVRWRPVQTIHVYLVGRYMEEE